MPRVVHRACHLCEAVCGLTFTLEGEQIVDVGPDPEDVFSGGYICPKGAAIADVYHDPDRLRTPVRRTSRGDFEPIGWDEAFRIAEERFRAIRRRGGDDALALYIGNPMAHNDGAMLMRTPLMKALRSKNVSSAGSQDVNPRFAVSYYLYGSSLTIPVPDIDRTDLLLCLGANPRVSNGSMMTAPNVRQRLAAIRRRGGRVVVVDPRRSETAREADQHLAILPGGDTALLMAMLYVLRTERRIDAARIERVARGWSAIERRLDGFSPAEASRVAGLEPATIHRLALEFADAPRSVAYSRVGVCTSAHATAATLATDLLNLAAGRLGAVGGAMFPTPAFDAQPVLRWTGTDGHARWHSRVRGLPETFGELPAATLAEEIETPGAGQVRGLITVAGNPVLSVPNGRRLERALEQLQFMVSVDIYVNETTRHAHLILPPAWSLCEPHVAPIFSGLSVRNVARWSPAVLSLPADARTDWQIMLELAYRLGGGPTGIKPLDWLYRLGRRVGWKWEPESQVDLLLRTGPWGDRFLPWSSGLSLKKLRRAPHGLDLGPLREGLGRIAHRDRRVHLDAPPLLAALDDASRAASGPADGTLLLIGRRELRSNNSWMHNVPRLTRGHARCVLLVHPLDAQQRGLADGGLALLASGVHQAEVPIRVSQEMRPGVVCLPHGWGHASSARWQTTAGAQPGVSFNDWTDDRQVEAIVGQSILNGVPVQLTAVDRPAGDDSTGPAASTAASGGAG